MTGPGGSETIFGDVRITEGGSGNDAWYLAEPIDPRPKSAPLVVMMHGYFEFSGHTQLGAVLRHTAAEGNVVIYPRWQTGPADPCPGSFNLVPCEVAAANAIKGAVSYLQANPTTHVQPRLADTTYIAHSFGAVLAVNLANKHQRYDIPQPKALWLDEPDDSGLNGEAEGAFDDDLTGIPAATKLVCLAGADGSTSPTQHVNLVFGYASRACNVLFPKLGHIPDANKSLVMNYADNHGTPALTAPHGVCAGDVGDADAYDSWMCWRSMDALRACALYNVDCEYALGDTPQNRYNGSWSDGTPVIGLKVQNQAPIRKDPVPERAPAPPPESFAPPVANFAHLRDTYAAGRPPRTVSGVALSAHGVAFVRVAIVQRVNGGCRQLTAAGRFNRLERCSQPTSWLWADGGNQWRMRIPRTLGPGRYRATAQAVDGYGAGHTRSARAGTYFFRVR